MEDELSFFSRAPTTAIADAAVHLGLDLIMRDVAPLAPFPEGRVAAPAATMLFAPARGEADPSRVSLYGAHEETPPGRFVVLAAQGSEMAVLGANGARVIHRRGAAGVVTDAKARDALEIRALGLPVWCGGVRPLPYSKRLVLAERGVAVRCGGARVAPGDIVVADADGVAVVPKEKAGAVLERTRIVMEVEEEFTRRFEAGESGAELVKMMRRKWE